jgi:uncharacterized phage protein gp47/JayE
MPWDRPTLQQLYQRISKDFSGRLLDGGTPLTRSVLAVMSKVWAGACHLMHGMLAWLFVQVFADTAEGPYLERWARIWGIFRKGAASAVGQVVFSGQETVPDGTLIQHQATSVVYIVEGDADPVDGVITARVKAALPGVDGNRQAGDALTLVVPLAGVVADGVTLPEGITGGVDAEDDEGLRRRFLDRLRQPPRGGSKHDYEAWACEVPGVTRAWCYPMGDGIGTVSLTFATDNAAAGPIPTQDMVQAVRDHIEPNNPAFRARFDLSPQVVMAYSHLRSRRIKTEQLLYSPAVLKSTNGGSDASQRLSRRPFCLYRPGADRLSCCGEQRGIVAGSWI